MIRRYRHTGWDLVASVLLLVCVAVAATILLLEANGYLVDFVRFDVEPSSLLVVRAQPKDVQLTLDGEPLAETWDGTWQITPGRHDLEIEAEGRQRWTQSFHVTPRRARVYESVILYLNPPVLKGVRAREPAEVDMPLIDSILQVRDGEIRRLDGTQSSLVTRFSRTPIAARQLDMHHLIVQLGNELHVIDIDGSNDRVLLTLANDTPHPLVIRDDGRLLGVIIGTDVYEYQLY